jgi:Na+-translocating ferredoxin:NAD+ oxidoreductase RnfG subunit
MAKGGLPELDDNGKVKGLPELNDDGIELSKKKDVTELSSGDTSSDLLSVNYKGEKYDVNPKTQEVFKGGKPINLSPQAKDYIAKNILGVSDKKPKYEFAPKAPDWAAGTGTNDQITIAANQPTIEQQGTEITPDVKAVLQKNNVDTDIFDNGKNPALLEQTVKDLKDYTGLDVDLKYPETLDKAIGQAKILRDVNAFDKMAKDAGMTPQKAVDVAYDFGAQKFLNGFDKDLFALDKQAKEAFANGDKEAVEKLKPQYEKLRKAFVAGYDDEITDLQTELLTKVSKDGKPLFPTEIADKQNQLNLLKKQRNGFFQTPDQVIKGLGEGDSDVSALDKQLQGKSPMEQLQIIAKAKTARYMLLGNKLGIKPSDILTEGNIRNMTVGGLEDKGLVNWSIDNIKNYMGYGDLNGEITSNDRKEFAKLHGELKSIMPILLINKTPIEAAEDNSGDIFLKTASQFAPATKAQNMTGQQVATTIQDVLSQANISNNALTPDAVESMDKKLKEYGFKQSLAQMGGQTAQIIIPMMVSSGLTGSALEALALSPRTAAVTRFLLNNPLGKVVKGAGEYGLAGKIANDTTELDLGTGATAGAVDAALDAFGGRFKLLKPWLRLKFGANAGKAADLVARTAAKGLGEFVQESGETLYQAWRDTPEGKSTMDTLQQQFGDLDDIVKFAVGTIVMGSGMSLSSELGFDKARLNAVSRMNPEQRAKFDAAVKYFKDKDNAAQQGAIDEVLPTAKTDVIQDSLKDTTEAISKLQAIADNVQSEDEVTPYNVTVNGVTYSGTTPAELRADIDYLDYINNKSNDELYKRNTGQTETPTNTEQVQQQPIAEESVGVESPINAAEQPETGVNAQENGQNVVTEKNEPIRQLGTGANVYFETDKYRVNDTKDGVTLLIQNNTNEPFPIANPTFDTPEEAVYVGKELQRIYPNGVPDAVLIDKVVENIRKEYAAPKQKKSLEVKLSENLPQGGEVKETVSEKQVADTLNELEPTEAELDAAYEHARSEENKAKQDTAENYNTGEPLSAIENAIHDNFKNPSVASWRRFADITHINDFTKGKPAATTRLQFMLRKNGAGIDDIANNASRDLGQEVTTQDVVDYILNRAENPAKFKYKSIQKAQDYGNLARENPQKFAEIAATAVDFNPDNDILKPETYDAMAGFPLEETDVELIKNYLDAIKDNAIEQEAFRADVKTAIDLRNSRRGGIETGKGVGEKQPTQKVNEKGSPISESPKDVTRNGGENKNAAEKEKSAIPTETVDDLLQAGQKRRAAKDKLPTTTMKDTATVILKDSDIEAIFQKDTDESLEVLMKLQEKLGIKKIC